jgi:hypothetical protein
MIFQNSMRSVMVGGSLPGLEMGGSHAWWQNQGSPMNWGLKLRDPQIHWLNWGDVGIQAVFIS